LHQGEVGLGLANPGGGESFHIAPGLGPFLLSHGPMRHAGAIGTSCISSSRGNPCPLFPGPVYRHSPRKRMN
jgi:hypothetical protein